MIKEPKKNIPKPMGAKSYQTFVWAICLNHDNFRIVIEVDEAATTRVARTVWKSSLQTLIVRATQCSDLMQNK